MLRIYNSLAREKQDFVPIRPGEVRMYVCGMTVYDYCHLGSARVMVVFDVVRRWLRASGFKVSYVRNITDIDDKIIKRAVENKETIGALTERFIHAMDEDESALGVEKPAVRAVVVRLHPLSVEAAEPAAPTTGVVTPAMVDHLLHTITVLGARVDELQRRLEMVERRG